MQVLKGASGSLFYELKGSYTSFEGMAFFLQDEDAEEQFIPVYDDGSFIGIQGSVRFEILKHVFLRAKLSQRFFRLTTSQDHGTGLPWELTER